MRMPRRDVQIFSLSMMDVISGAMGAFLIIMVVLMRYYKEDGDIAIQREQMERLLDEIQRQVDEAMEQLQMSTDVDVKDLMQRLQILKSQLEHARREVQRMSNDLQAARNRVNQLRAENQQLQAEKQSLEDENRVLNNRLAWRRPFGVLATWHSSTSVDVDLEFEINSKFTDRDDLAYFDPDGKLPMLTGQLGINATGSSNSEFACVRDSWPGAEFKIYVVLRREPALATTSITVTADGDDMFKNFESVQLDANKRWEFIGVLKTDDTGKTTAEEATQAQRDADRRNVELRMRNKKPANTTTQPAGGDKP